MADKNILEEQKKAREDFLKLKKMQQGEIEPGPKPSEVAIKPKTFGEKLRNFWFYYRWHTIGIILSVLVLAIVCVQCAKREKTDFDVVYFAYEPCVDMQLDKVEEYLQGYASDINGDGEVKVQVINCSLSKRGDANYKNAILSKIQTQIIGNRETVMYIMDDEAYEYLNGVVDGGVFQGEKVSFGKEFFEKTKTQEFGYLPKDLGVYLRRIKGTNLENDKKVEIAINECKKVVEAIKNEP